MAYVPAVPGVPPPMSYGQGFGDWQKYAGFSAQKPFGSMPGAAPATAPVANPAVVPGLPTTTLPTALPVGQMGQTPVNAFGTTPTGQYGSLEEAAKADENNY